MYTLTHPAAATLLFAPILLCACTETSPTELGAAPSRAALVGAPTELVSVTSATDGVTFWPYTDTNFEATPQDPINLVFFAESDPRNVRDALLSLDGTRAGPFAAFNCTWTDAIGGQQTTFAEPGGWSGSSIQLECGTYGTIRFHIRLFRAGSGTVANAHLDLLIPGTTDHQVLTWELGEKFVTYDLSRTGYLAAVPAQSAGITPAPTFREIPPIIYNGLPVSLRALTGGPLAGSVQTPVGIPNDGFATVIRLVDAPPAPGSQHDFVVAFGQTIPKPFCASTGAFVRVDGPVRLRQTVSVGATGELTAETIVEGDLTVRSVDPATGAMGEPTPARVTDRYLTVTEDGSSTVSSKRDQRLILPRSAMERLQERLHVVTGGAAHFRSTETCR